MPQGTNYFLIMPRILLALTALMTVAATAAAAPLQYKVYGAVGPLTPQQASDLTSSVWKARGTLTVNAARPSKSQFDGVSGGTEGAPWSGEVLYHLALAEASASSSAVVHTSIPLCQLVAAKGVEHIAVHLSEGNTVESIQYVDVTECTSGSSDTKAAISKFTTDVTVVQSEEGPKPVLPKARSVTEGGKAPVEEQSFFQKYVR